MQKSHYDLNDSEFEKQFSEATLEESLFTHEAHLRLAWIHLKQYGEEQAILNICSQLQNYVKALGAEDKYNATLTVAAIKAVNHFIGKSASLTFAKFIDENPRLKHNFKDLMQAHYKTDIYNSKTAKASYIEPDLIPFT